MAQKMVAEVGRPFCAILSSMFSGDVLEFMLRTYFGEMEQNSFQRTDRAKDGRGSWEVILHNS